MNTTEGITIIGLTGQSGAGKSTAARFFRDLGVSVIDCDEVSRQVAELPDFLDEVSKVFPDCVENGALKRQQLAGIVFNDQQKLDLYTSLIFPYITYEIFRRIREVKAAGQKLVILDAPTLFESDIHILCAAVISVIAPFELKVKRILERDGIPVDLVKSRISAQHEEKYFQDRSDWLIVNDGDGLQLKEKVSETYAAMKERFDV